jgi:hypothetical protein
MIVIIRTRTRRLAAFSAALSLLLSPCAVLAAQADPIEPGTVTEARVSCVVDVDEPNRVALLSPNCGESERIVKFDNIATLPVPDPGDYVVLYADGTIPSSTFTVAALRSQDGRLLTFKDGVTHGPAEVMAEFSALPELQSISGEGGDGGFALYSTTANDGSPNAKCSDSASYTLSPLGGFNVTRSVPFWYNIAGQPMNYDNYLWVDRIIQGATGWTNLTNSCSINVSLPNVSAFFVGGSSLSLPMTLNSCNTGPDNNVVGWVWGPNNTRLAATCVDGGNTSGPSMTIAINSGKSW